MKTKTFIIFFAILFCGVFGLAEGSSAACGNAEQFICYVDNTTNNTCFDDDGAGASATNYNSTVGQCGAGDGYDTKVYNKISDVPGQINVAAVVDPGDTVTVKDGVYTDNYNIYYGVYLRRGGTASNWITFKSENKWGAVIDGQNSTPNCLGFDNSAAYIRIEDFEIKNCEVGIISSDVPATSNIYVYGNHIHNLSHHGIDLADDNNYWTIDSNIMHDLDTTNPVFNTYGVYVSGNTSNTTIINNIFYGIADGWHIHIYQHGNPNPQSNNKIINNTFADESPNFTGHIIVAAVSPNLLIENNIFYNPTTSAIRAYYDNDGQNVIVRNNITNVGSICSGDYCSGITYSANQTGTNPLFVDSNNRNYRLQANSPAINAGLNTNAPALDYAGATRGNPPDIGAYEYVLAGSDTTAPTSPFGLTVL